LKIALTFILGILLLGQAADRPATIEGIARNLRTGEPLADVRVTVTPEVPAAGAAAARSATTDAEGRFTIAGVAPGRYNLAAARTLFFRPRRNAGVVAVTVAADQRLRDVQVLLMPTGVIAGRVVDENREPLRSVRIEALRSEYQNGLRTWVNAGSNTTDDRGEYRVFNLQPGTYYIRAAQGNLATPGPALYYPGVPESQDASPIQVEAGGERGAIDIAMRRIAEYAVKFRLGGVPPGSAVTFTVQKRDSRFAENLLARPESLPDNTYQIGRLPPGAYDIFAQVSTPPGVQPRTVTHAGKIPVNIGRANEDLGTVSVRATIPVTGRIVVPEPLPSLDLKRLTLTLRPLDIPPGVSASVRGGATPPGFNEDGTFVLNNVAAGRFQIQMTGLPPDIYLVSARAGAREILDTGYTVGGDQNPLELTLGGPGSVSTVEGAVFNSRGEPVPSSTVVLVPAGERRANPAAFRTTYADQQGNFSIRSVLPGEYKVLAWEEVEPGAYMDPEFLQGFETRGEALRIQRGSQNAVSVRVIPAP
jgi:protocatechuate 3,4-dioxygenase beta subunit